MAEQKKWYKSKTIVLNVIGAIILILESAEFMSVIPNTWIPYTALALTIMNIVLRMATKEAVKW